MSVVAILWLLAGVMFTPIVFRICTYWWFPRRATRELEKALLMKPSEHPLFRDGDKPLVISWLRSRRYPGHWMLAYRQWPDHTTLKGLEDLTGDIEMQLHCTFRAEKRGKFLYCEFGNTQLPDPRPGQPALKYAEFVRQYPRPEGALVVRCGVSTHGLLAPDLAEVGTLMVIGQRGGGKSVMLRTLITELVTKYEPDQLRLALIDLKGGGLELGLFEDLRHLVAPVARGSLEEAVNILQLLLNEMQRRNQLFKALGVVNIKGYNSRVPDRERLPYTILVIDEYSMLAPGMVATGSPERRLRQQAEEMLGQLANLSRNVGILEVVASQRPEAKVMPLQFRDQFHALMAFRVRERTTSRMLLDNEAAATLPQVQGRFIWQSGLQQMPVQAPLLKDDEARKLVDPLRRRALPASVPADAIEGKVVPEKAEVA